ncbi:MAG: FAD-dependent oxidoreductase [Firmicutes bacterium]|nr:FAD-dependent oxidoreductase [Bacillota bacterium]
MATVAVIGGGPAGMMAAIKASEHNKVILIDKNNKLGKKLYITGKGRCNLTNAKDINDFFDNIPGNPNFLYSSLYSFTNEDAMAFVRSLGVKLKVERGDRVFPESDKSSDIISAFESEIIKRGICIKLNSQVTDVEYSDNRISAIKLNDGTRIEADHYILCTGGISYPQTGSTGEGHILAHKLGHRVTKLFPSLVPIEVKEEWVRELQGLSLRNVEFKLLDARNKVIYKDFGEMLFTHYGLSGPIVLSGSRTVNFHKNLKAAVNLKPALTADELDKRIQKDFAKNINKAFKNSLDELLPKKMIPVIVELSHIDPDKKVNMITKEERKQLVTLLQNLEFNVKGLRPVAEAIITAGGIDVKEIDPSTMKSKIINNLSFAGEIIDIDAVTGGYNIQLALSTGYLAGTSIG